MSNNVAYNDGRLVVTRLFNAPREAVFDAWIATSKVELWWGCGYATKVKSTIDPCVGGKYEHLMTLKDVGEHQHYGVITEYKPPELLAYEVVDTFREGEKMRVRVVFTENGATTKVCLTQDNLVDAHSEFVMAGWSAAFDKLNELLEEGIFQK